MKTLVFFVLSWFLFPFNIWAESSFCDRNAANFDYELTQPFNTTQFVKGWGLKRNLLNMRADFNQCINDLDWQRKRIIAAADYWIKQKLNYCHHYLPTYSTPMEQRNALKGQGGYCSQAKDIMPNSVYYKQQARWNYSGQANESINNWLNNTMWQGMDCSNYTSFLYNFAFGRSFSSKVEWQAGQRKGGSQKNLSPNQQQGNNVLDNPSAAGRLVCVDNTLEISHSCNGHGGYLSVIDQQGLKHKGMISASDLALLQLHPGDLLFISATNQNSLNPSLVTHVAIWTGKQVGYGPNDIPPSQIAPNGLCPQESWMPHIGDWVISDSHYQGADYRVLTPCFYLNNLWGVRRVI
ncbi:hypothetical protein [Legionella sp. km772]|uniref:hypothetical protein n=1 Tax=Legionella sp. km772 TaxID=2498111 RepID=UPI000F8E5809|nr:hypothetical protein [Legionella sp. km772]RUR04455.1 hypothetical protein ELY15_15475 [Legionella sp. km772]